MLNISINSIRDAVSIEQFRASRLLKKSKVRRLTLYLFSGLAIVLIVSLFLPWTQNIQAKGYVTTRLPGQRPQAIQSVISGRLEQWYVMEGDYVDAGDTIVFISEVKSEYFDPELIERTSEQVSAKSASIETYDEKISALRKQYAALEEGMQFEMEKTRNRIEQAYNAIKIDSAELAAGRMNLDIAGNQVERIRELHSKGLKSLTDLQEKELKYQEQQAKVTVLENKLLNRRNMLANLNIELFSIEREYADKLAKSLSEQQTAYSDRLESVASTAKLQNQLANYSMRQSLYYIRAPQSGYVTKTVKAGIGEFIKEGTDIAMIMPSQYDLAVEVYVQPQDIPLLDLGKRVRLRFDGWPAIVISGWPESSTGLFSGEVSAIDRFISPNGQYRILIVPDKEVKHWPERLSIGTGANAFILLKDVPIWYEIWRQLNGFPPDYYNSQTGKDSEVKRKAPLKSVK